MLLGDEKPATALIDCSGWLSSLAWLLAAQNSLGPYKEEIEALARMAASVSARCGRQIFYDMSLGVAQAFSVTRVE